MGTAWRRALLSLATVAILSGVALAQRPGTHYDESRVPAYTLPDPLVCNDGTAVTDEATWTTRRRPEILALFEEHVYGRSPGKPEHLAFEVRSVATDALAGQAVRKEVRITVGKGDKTLPIDLLLYLPAGAKKPVPVFLTLNFYGNHSINADPGISLSTAWMRNRSDGEVVDNRATEKSRGVRSSRWAIDQILARGYGLASIYYGDIDPDFDDGFQNGVHPLFYKDGQKTPAPDEWGSIAAWA
jgi:(4-O-methyl)-D-glucuronate---lignin esterase